MFDGLLLQIPGLDAQSLRLYPEIAWHLLAALVGGGAIGLERSFHGRPAGFRTHALVSLASCVLMLVTLYQAYWFDHGTVGAVTMDPTRMAQGIMTGIGFLGAGVIFKDGLTVRGLTTAASIWITAAIGILMGIGFYAVGVAATVLTLGVLVLFHRIEQRLPSLIYAQLNVRFPRDEVMLEDELRRLLGAHHCSLANLSYRLEEGDAFEYRMMLRTRQTRHLAVLARTLGTLPAVRQFRLSPTGD